MLQVFRRVVDKKGKVQIQDVPAPNVSADRVLVDTRYTVISSGTEGATLGKTFPELIKQTLNDPWMRNAVKHLVFGASPEVVKNIVLDELTLMRAVGYSGSGIVLEVGERVQGIRPGDRVAFAAEGHAEVVAPSKNLTVVVPEGVTTKDAAFVTLGGIAMQGVRRAEIELGEQVVVIGLGLVGLITAQLVNAAGGHVIGIDLNSHRLEDLKNLLPHCSTVNSRAADPVQAVLDLTSGYGADAVIVCAASKDAAIANQAMKMSRKQGRVVFVGIVKMDLERMPFFRNELDIRFSRAYGPGSYDIDYDKGRVDYPQHYVRWTENRNLAEFIRLLQEKRVNVAPLIGAVYPVEQAQTAYDEIGKNPAQAIATLLEYKAQPETQAPRSVAQVATQPHGKGEVAIGIVGCGNFTRTTHIPNLHNNPGFRMLGVASATGANAASIVRRYAIPQSTTDYRELLSQPLIDAVLVATRHDLHADIASDALAAGKHVFVEKPVALSWEQHNALERAIKASNRVYMVGYNRRYAPLAIKLKELLDPERPIMIHYQVCVPEVPADHWTLNPTEGGGRLIGEAEHFFDLVLFLAEAAVTKVTARCIMGEGQTVYSQFNFSVEMALADRALGTVNYTSYAAPGTPRETVTVYQGQRTFMLEDFKKLSVVGGKKTVFRNRFGDMGHRQELAQFLSAIRHGETKKPEQLLAASKVALNAMDSLLGQIKTPDLEPCLQTPLLSAMS